MTKKDFKEQIIAWIKAGRLDPCNGAEFGEIYTDLPQYYWTVKDGQVVEGSPYYVDEDQSGFHFGITVADVEGYTEKVLGELSDDDVKQAMLDIVAEFGVDDWYDQYQEA